MTEAAKYMKTFLAIITTLITTGVHASIIYSGVMNISSVYPGTVALDLDNNGFTDLSILQNVIGGTDITLSFPSDSYVLRNSVVFPEPIPTSPSALSLGYYISASNPSYTWTQWPAIISRWDEGTSSWSGTLAGDETAYVGLQFDIAGNSHHAWMRMNLSDSQPSSAPLMVVDWAYESAPNVSIQVGAIPEPSTLSLLSISCVFTYLGRKRKTKGAQQSAAGYPPQGVGSPEP